MRVLGIDYGRRRIGLAISDPDGILATPLPVYARRGARADIEYIVRLAREKDAEMIVIGLPLNMDGSSGEMADEVVAFAERLSARVGVPILTFDERLTSEEADRVLIQADVSRKRRKEVQDSLAAVLILQGYLERARKEPPPERAL